MALSRICWWWWYFQNYHSTCVCVCVWVRIVHAWARWARFYLNNFENYRKYFISLFTPKKNAPTCVEKVERNSDAEALISSCSKWIFYFAYCWWWFILCWLRWTKTLVCACVCQHTAPDLFAQIINWNDIREAKKKPNNQHEKILIKISSCVSRSHPIFLDENFIRKNHQQLERNTMLMRVRREQKGKRYIRWTFSGIYTLMSTSNSRLNLCAFFFLVVFVR